MRSAIYEGLVRHRRRTPVEHAFEYRVAMPLLYLDEIDDVCSRHPAWGHEQWRPVNVRRRDYLGLRDVTLDRAVRDLVARETGRRPAGPVALLTNPRTWGWQFNPISLYFCFDESGERVEALVADVTSTPWHERRAYVVGAAGTYEVDKEMHVSPFVSMDVVYRITYHDPGRHLVVSIDVVEHGETVLETSLALSRCEIDRRELGRVLWAHPVMTWRVSWAIYRQALSLWRKHVPFVAHPDRKVERV